MKKMLVIFVLASVLLLAGCLQPPPTEVQNQVQNGRVVFTLADAAPNMGVISKIIVTVDKVMVQTPTQGWITVSSTSRTYDLIQLKATGVQALLADVNLSEGTYNQVQLSISKVVVTDATGDHEAKLPSRDLKIVGAFDAKANTTSVVVFDILAEKSLHATGKGEYILTPVVNLQSRGNADVTISGTTVEVRNGNVKTNIVVGMDENGAVAADSIIPIDANVSIDDNGKIYVHGKDTIVGNDRDSHGCIPSAGYTWCEATQKCYRSWEENCTAPLVGGDKDVHGCIGSAGYSWCEVSQKCYRSWEENCTASVDSNQDAHGCAITAGYSWCQSAQKCYHSPDESCYYQVQNNSASDCMKTPGKSWCDKEQKCINPATELC